MFLSFDESEHWARLEEERLAGEGGGHAGKVVEKEESKSSYHVEKTGFVKNLYTEDPFTGQQWGKLETEPEPEKPPNPFAKVDKETEYLRNELASRDRRIKELEAKIALYEEYERQKKVGLGLICSDPAFGNGGENVLNSAGCPKIEMIDPTGPCLGLLKSGDEILAVDGADMRGMTAKNLRGVLNRRMGASTDITYKRYKDENSFDIATVTVTRPPAVTLTDEKVLEIDSACARV